MKSLASHVTLTLGLHVQKFLCLAACDLPRTSEGRPKREVVKRWVQGDKWRGARLQFIGVLCVFCVSSTGKNGIT